MFQLLTSWTRPITQAHSQPASTKWFRTNSSAATACWSVWFWRHRQGSMVRQWFKKIPPLPTSRKIAKASYLWSDLTGTQGKSDKDFLLDLWKQTALKAIKLLSKCTVKDGKADLSKPCSDYKIWQWIWTDNSPHSDAVRLCSIS